MNFEKQDIEIEVGNDNSNKEPPKGPRPFKIKIGTRDVALLLAFVLIVVGLLVDKITMQWAIWILLLVAGGEGVSQFLHYRK